MVINLHPEWEDSPNRVQLGEVMEQPLFVDIVTGAVTSRICVQCAQQRFAALRMNVSKSTSRMVLFVAYVDMVTMTNLITDGRLTTRIIKLLGTVRILRFKIWPKGLLRMEEVINNQRIPIIDSLKRRAKGEARRERRETPKEERVKARERTEKREEISSPRSRWRKRLAQEELIVPAF